MLVLHAQFHSLVLNFNANFYHQGFFIDIRVKLLHSKDPRDQAGAARALSRLANINDENKHKVKAAASDGTVIRPLVELLGHQYSDDVNEHAAYLLYIILSHGHANNQAKVVEVGAIPLLVSLLGPKSSVKVQSKAAGLLSILATDADNRVSITEANAIPPLVSLLVCQYSAVVQLMASAALHYVSWSADSQVRIVEAGAISPLVSLLGPQSSTEVQSNSVGVLRYLASNADIQIKIIESGAIPPLVSLLGHQSSPEVQSDAAYLLSLLSQNVENQVKIVEAGAIPPLVSMLAPHGSAEMQQNALLELGFLANNSIDYHAQIVAAGAIPSLVALLGRQSSEWVRDKSILMLAMILAMLQDTVDSCAVAAACNMVNHSQIIDEIIAAGAFPLLVGMLGPQNPTDLQGKSAIVLSGLVCNADSQAKLALADAIPPLVALLGSQSPSLLVQESAAQVLGSLALNDVETSAKIRSAGGVSALNQLLASSTNKHVKQIAESSLQIIANE